MLTPFNRRNLRLHPSAFEMPKLRSPPVGLFFFLVLGGIAEIVLHPPLHRAGKKKPHYQIDSRVSFIYLVGREGLEPATKGL